MRRFKGDEKEISLTTRELIEKLRKHAEGGGSPDSEDIPLANLAAEFLEHVVKADELDKRLCQYELFRQLAGMMSILRGTEVTGRTDSTNLDRMIQKHEMRFTVHPTKWSDSDENLNLLFLGRLVDRSFEKYLLREIKKDMPREAMD